MQKNVICYAIIVAGGLGTRMGTSIKKQYLSLGGMPVLSRTIKIFSQLTFIDKIFIAVPEEDLSFCKQNIISPFEFARSVHLVAGGKSRQESVQNCLFKARESVPRTKDRYILLVHDGVRPLVPKSVIIDCFNKTLETGACIPVLPCMDTVKFLNPTEKQVTGTIDRKNIGLAQTPQGFDMDILTDAFNHARISNFTGTDESSLLEHANYIVSTINGSPNNIKLTTTADVVFAKYLLDNMN